MCARTYCKNAFFSVDDKPILIVMAGDAKVDNHKYKEYFGQKAKMLSQDEVESKSDTLSGGVCPFGINGGITVYLDESLKRFETVFPACGSTNSAIELTIDEMERFFRLQRVDKCVQIGMRWKIRSCLLVRLLILLKKQLKK